MNCYVIYESSDENIALSERLNNYIRGIKKQLRKSKSKLVVVEPDNLTEATAYFKEHNSRPAIIVCGITFMWVRSVISKLLDASIHPIILSPFSFQESNHQYTDKISTISFDEADAVSEIIQYFIENNMTKIAYFGFNPNINSHKIQHYTFNSMKKVYDLPSLYPFADTYINLDYLDTCSIVFLSRVKDYEAVLCSTPEYAIKLIYDLKANGLYSDNLHIATIGSSPLTRLSSPSLTTFDFDAAICGEKAVKLYFMLVNDNGFSKLDVKIRGTLTVSESTSFMPFNHTLPKPCLDTETLPNPEFQLVEDKELDAINKIENLLYKSDEIDMDYIHAILNKKETKHFAEEHFISENTLSYRIRNMCKCLGVQTKGEMRQLLLKWLR